MFEGLICVFWIPLIMCLWAYGAGMVEAQEMECQYATEARARKKLLEWARGNELLGKFCGFHYFKLTALYNDVPAHRVRGLFHLAEQMDPDRPYSMPDELDYYACKPYAGGDFNGYCGGCDACLAMQRNQYSEAPNLCFKCGADWDREKNRCASKHTLRESMERYQQLCAQAVAKAQPIRTSYGAQLRRPMLAVVWPRGGRNKAELTLI